MTMGEKILNMRKARGWRQEELAEYIGVTRQAVSRWESGAAKPDADKIIAVCDLFGVSADYLLRDQGGDTVTQEQENEMSNRIRVMTPRRWTGGILVLLCCGTLLAIWVMSVMYPVSLWPDQQLRAFLYAYRLNFVWYGAWVGLIVGLWKSFSPKPLKAYPVREWAEKVRERFGR